MITKPDPAFDLVLRIAEARANGHEHCAEIIRAVQRCRELLKIAPPAPSPEPDTP